MIPYGVTLYGLVPDGTKQLAVSTLTGHQWGSAAFAWDQFRTYVFNITDTSLRDKSVNNKTPTIHGQQHPFSTINSYSWKKSKFHKVENSTTIKGLEPRTPLIHAEYSSHPACECGTFQFIIWETGSNSIDILCVKVNTWNANRGQHHPFSIVNSCSWNSWNFMKYKIAH